MGREQLLRRLEAAKERLAKADDLVRRQRAILPSFLGTMFEPEARDLLVRLENYLANQIAELDSVLDLLDGNGGEDPQQTETSLP
jgi:hypothetical protein